MNLRRSSWISLLLVVAFTSGTLTAQTPAEGKLEDIKIVVKDARKELVSIAIPDLRVVGGAEKDKYSKETAQVLRDDLELSGAFKILDPKSFGTVALEKEGLEEKETDVKAWELTGAQALIKGLVSVDGSKASVELRLFVGGKSVALKHNTWRGEASKVRRQVHEFANDVVEYFTGTRGIFGSQIAFVKKSGPGRKDIYVMDSDGQGQYSITENNSINMLPSFTPTGSILYTSFVSKNPDLYLYEGSKKGASKLSDRNGLNTGGVMSRNGKIALTLSKDGNSEIYVIGGDGKLVSRLTTSAGIDTSPSWSPDGSQLAFVSDRSGSPQIYVMNADGSGVRKLTSRGKYNQTPEWSPDGSKIAFTGRDDSYNYDIFVADVKTGDLTRLTQAQGNNEDPTFSPDSRLVAFSSTRDGGANIYISSADGLVQKRITQKGMNLSPSWSK